MIILSHVLKKSSRTGARASWAGRKKGRKGGSSSPLSIFSSRRLKCAPNCRPAILSVRAQAVCRPGDSASPGRLQPISLRETLLFEKWSRTLRVCLMADFYAYAPLAAPAGARASWAGRTKGRKGGESIFYALSAPSQSSLFLFSLSPVLARPTAGTRCSSQLPSYPRSARSGRRHFPSCPR